MHSTRLPPWLVLIPGALLVLLLALPVVALLVRAAVEGALLTAATNRVVLEALGLSLLTTAISLVLAVALGTPLAWALARRRVPPGSAG